MAFGGTDGLMSSSSFEMFEPLSCFRCISREVIHQALEITENVVKPKPQEEKPMQLILQKKDVEEKFFGGKRSFTASEWLCVQSLMENREFDNERQDFDKYVQSIVEKALLRAPSKEDECLTCVQMASRAMKIHQGQTFFGEDFIPLDVGRCCLENIYFRHFRFCPSEGQIVDEFPETTLKDDQLQVIKNKWEEIKNDTYTNAHDASDCLLNTMYSTIGIPVQVFMLGMFDTNVRYLVYLKDIQLGDATFQDLRQALWCMCSQFLQHYGWFIDEIWFREHPANERDNGFNLLGDPEGSDDEKLRGLLLENPNLEIRLYPREEIDEESDEENDEESTQSGQESEQSDEEREEVDYIIRINTTEATHHFTLEQVENMRARMLCRFLAMRLQHKPENFDASHFRLVDNHTGEVLDANANMEEMLYGADADLEFNLVFAPPFTVHVKQENERRYRPIQVANRFTTVGELKQFVSQAFGDIPLSEFRLLHQGIDLINDVMKVFEVHLGEDSMLLLKIKARGGGKRVLVQKKEKVMSLVKKSYTIVSKRHLETEDQESIHVPSQIQSLSSSIHSLINEVSLKLDTEQEVLRPVLNTLPEEKLNALLEIHKEKSSTYTEDKMIATATIILGELEVLENIIGKSHQLKNQLIHCFIRAYAQEYSNTVRSEACYDNEKFRNDVKTALAFHQGFRRSMEVSSVPSQNDVSEQDTRCTLM